MNPRPVKWLRTLAAVLALSVYLTPAAGATGFWDWLTGAEDEPAMAQVTPAPTFNFVPVELPDPTAEPERTAGTDEAGAWADFAPKAGSATPEAPAGDMDIAADVPIESPEPTLPPIEDAPMEDDGVLRVALRSLNSPQQLHLTLAGVYAVEGDPGFRFDRDTRITLSAADGDVYLWVGGLTMNMGSALRLTRHRAAEGAENGLYIDESEKDALYCGDLTVAAEGDQLNAVVSVAVEEYLYGVVAYEMSDSFPLEALKAQAVAARTYAMQRKWRAGDRDYDLVDTTADQVYKGFDPSFTNVIQAVDVTEGVVGLYDGTFATCYYTASNGGQTALASQIWGGTGNDGYLAMTDDPYDVENPRSLRNDLTITPQCVGSERLKAMLEADLGRQLRAEGCADGEWALEAIEAIKPAHPRFEGSRMYDDLIFTLRARTLEPVATEAPSSGGDAAEEVTPEPTAEASDAVSALSAALIGAAEPTPTPEPTEAPKAWRVRDERYTVTLRVYDDIKRELSLGLNKADYELIDVETLRDEAGATTGFTLVMRRFGHGVGMSQRGAQWMAGHYGMGWRDILAFYYPGMTVARMRWPEQALTSLEALPSGVGGVRAKPTPTPTPAPLPALKAGEYYAVVTATTLNVRQEPTTAARVVTQLASGRRLIVSGDMDGDGWVPVHTAEVSGYVKAEYLRRE